MGFIFGAGTGTDYSDLERKREIARMLAQQASQGATTIPQGLTQLGQGIMSAILQGQDKKATSAYNAKFSPVASALLGGKGAASSASLPPSVDRKTIASLISETAKDVGISPEDLATAISYETAGTFDPTKKGPTTKWGQHKGLIQFGEPQAKQFGVDWNDPVNSQLGPGKAVAQYLKAAGVKPGMGMMDVYSAINAGAPGRYGASDAAAGGAPGTVADKVNSQMADHRAKALALLAPSQQEAPGMAPQPQIMPASAEMAAPASAAPQAPMAPQTAYQRMMQQGIAKGEAGGLQGPVGRQQMASVMGHGGDVNPGILSALGLGGSAQPPQAPMAAAPNPNDPAVQTAMGKVAADTNAMSQPQIQQGAEQELAQVPTEQLVSLMMDPRANPQQRQFLQTMVERRMQEQDPAYQLELQTKQLQLQKLQQELSASGVETAVVGDALVNKQTGDVIYKAPTKPNAEILQDKSTGEILRIDKNDPNSTPQVIRKGGMTTEPPRVVNVAQPDGSEVAVQWDGEKKQWVPLKAPQGGEAVRTIPKLTEQQSKDLVYYQRGQSALANLDKLEGALTSVGDTIKDNVPLMGNLLTSKDYQLANQAGREFLAAILRKDTGAAITGQEMEIYGKMYLPQPGDSAEVLAQKREARGIALEAIKTGLGAASRALPEQPAEPAAPVVAAPPAAATEAPKAGTVVDGAEAIPEGAQAKGEDGKIYWKRNGKLWVNENGKWTEAK